MGRDAVGAAAATAGAPHEGQNRTPSPRALPHFVQLIETSTSWKRAAALRLTGGTYLISASLVQPVFYSESYGPWNAAREATFQRLAETARPLLSDDRTQRAAALEKLSALKWQQTFLKFVEYRFARLAAFLRQREPDENINYSILVYHLTDADLARALDGPQPPP